MRHLLLAIGFLSAGLFASVTDEEKFILNTYFGEAGRKVQLGTLIDEGGNASTAKDGYQAKKLVRSTYDVSADGGTVASRTLGETLPANAIITQSWYQIITQFVDGGSGTVKIACGSTDILAAADITGKSAGDITAGEQDGTAANMDDIGAVACDLTATVATAAQTAGKLVLWVEYVNTDGN